MSMETRGTGNGPEHKTLNPTKIGASQMTQGFSPKRHRPEEVDRSDLLQRLSDSLHPNGLFRSAAIWASTAASTAQISLEYAESRRKLDPSCSVFWVPGENAESLIFSYKLHAQHLGIEDGHEGSRLLAVVRDRIEAEPNWLLVLSSVVDLSLFTIGGASTMNTSLLAYVPKSNTGAVLWTTSDKTIFAASTADALSIKTIILASPMPDTTFNLGAAQLQPPRFRRSAVVGDVQSSLLSSIIGTEITHGDDHFQFPNRKNDRISSMFQVEDGKSAQEPATKSRRDVSKSRHNRMPAQLARPFTNTLDISGSYREHESFMNAASKLVRTTPKAEGPDRTEHGISLDLGDFNIKTIPEAFADVLKLEIER
jgi:hypothetical protein